MANTAALLGTLLCTNADINYYTQQSIYWNAKYEANMAKLEEQVKYHEKWEQAFDSAIDNTKDLTAGGVTVAANNKNEALADAYADAKVRHYDEELSLELADLDIEYDTMKTMYDTLLEELRAKKDSEKEATSTAASDTGLLSSGG
ncbi:MAG: hypothetical protein E7Z92_06575 [Cyanobacteria bacterium SIG31]|nr:hypothetical protein [Cyanobacteria bacterium SIG31]